MKIYVDTFVSLLQKALPVELKLFNMDCLKNMPITEESTYSIYYEHRPVNYIIMFEVNQSLLVQKDLSLLNVGREKLFQTTDKKGL